LNFAGNPPPNDPYDNRNKSHSADHHTVLERARISKGFPQPVPDLTRRYLHAAHDNEHSFPGHSRRAGLKEKYVAPHMRYSHGQTKCKWVLLEVEAEHMPF